MFDSWQFRIERKIDHQTVLLGLILHAIQSVPGIDPKAVEALTARLNAAEAETQAALAANPVPK